MSGIGKLPNWVKPLMIVVSGVGSPLATTILFFIITVLTYVNGNSHLFVTEIWVLAIIPLGGIVKILTRRTRPETIYVQRMMFKTYSFPSGHAYGSSVVFGFIVFMCLRYLDNPWNWLLTSLLLGFICMVGISRVYLGAHFASDVIGAWLLGGPALILIMKF